jgi:hypothetical protein
MGIMSLLLICTCLRSFRFLSLFNDNECIAYDIPGENAETAS